MERTAEFKALLASAGSTDQPGDRHDRIISPFMRAAKEQQQDFVQLRRRLQVDAGQGNAVQVCKDCKEAIARCQELEHLIEDTTGLSAIERRQSGQLVQHRKELLAGLFEDMQNFAKSVQSAQASELLHEREVASYFCASASSTMAAPIPDEPDPWKTGSGEQEGLPEDSDDEAQTLVAMFANDMDQIQETQRKTQEVSALVTQFSMEVSRQQESIDNITNLAEESIDDVKKAEKHLEKAIKNSNSYRFWIVCWFTGSAIFLLIFDYLDSRMPI
jgi:hypothetical protein